MLALLVAVLALRSSARGQRPPDVIAVEYPAGWNIASFAGNTSSNLIPLDANFHAPPDQTYYRLQPGEGGYRLTSHQTVKPGLGYWVYVPASRYFELNTSVLRQTEPGVSASLTLPAGECALVGNPSAGASARVEGADLVEAFDPSANAYIAGTLLGIGQGAFACNSSDTDEAVSIVERGDVLTFTEQDFGTPKPYPNGGRPYVVLTNDSPYWVTATVFVAETGAAAGLGVGNGIILPPCKSCPEYRGGMHPVCNPAAPAVPVLLEVPSYTLQIHFYGRNIEDYVGTMHVQGDTRYETCVWVKADRDQAALP